MQKDVYHIRIYTHTHTNPYITYIENANSVFGIWILHWKSFFFTTSAKKYGSGSISRKHYALSVHEEFQQRTRDWQRKYDELDEGKISEKGKVLHALKTRISVSKLFPYLCMCVCVCERKWVNSIRVVECIYIRGKRDSRRQWGSGVRGEVVGEGGLVKSLSLFLFYLHVAVLANRALPPSLPSFHFPLPSSWWFLFSRWMTA